MGLPLVPRNIFVNHVVATGCLSPESFLVASRFLGVNGLPESPPPTMAIGTIPVGLVLFFVVVSNGIIGVTVLSR